MELEKRTFHDLQFSHKEDAEKYCQEHGTTIKHVILDNINGIQEALSLIEEKVKNDENLENEDWLKAAIPLRHVMNALGNKWYLNKKS